MSVQKYVITGHILEVYDYEKYCCGRGGKKTKNEKENIEDIKEDVKNKILENYSNHNVVRSNEKLKESTDYLRLDSLISNTYPVYEAEYETEFLGKCKYKQFNLER